MKDEVYKEIVSTIKMNVSYRPGNLLEEKILKSIKRQKRYSKLRKLSIFVLIGGFVVTSMILINIDNKEPSSKLYTYENNKQTTDYNDVIEDFEPIVNISLVSDGL